MKKRFIGLMAVTLVLAVLLSICAFGVEGKAAFVLPGLSFIGKNAHCSLYVDGAGQSDSISAVIKLWYGFSCLKTWTASATGSLSFVETYEVSSTGKYNLTVDVSIKGIAQPQILTSATCK